MLKILFTFSMGFKKEDYSGKPSLLWRLFKVLLMLVFFPYSVRRSYVKHNSILALAEKEGNQSSVKQLNKYRMNNTKLINIFIHTPLAITFLVTAILFYLQFEGIVRLGTAIADIPKVTITKPKVMVNNFKHYYNSVKSSAQGINLVVIYQGFLICYSFALIGAIILSLNPARKEERKMKEVLLSNKCLDANGNPWQVCWTPEAIIFFTYQCDPEKFWENKKFWNTINFKPDAPIQFRNDSNVLIFTRAYDLPFNIPFDINHIQKS